ncbi:hypothetical protein F2P81_018130 [Scophthalmus maximus]|uniref:Uncharacterized protein n=1 Tax=Scophthalmus maximus TaxID=52904 RepID=A0A6A4S9J5_SCOMX|nr:hypothetical protein F2P81_018130 [Scophthalmus maximus]
MTSRSSEEKNDRIYGTTEDGAEIYSDGAKTEIHLPDNNALTRGSDKDGGKQQRRQQQKQTDNMLSSLISSVLARSGLRGGKEEKKKKIIMREQEPDVNKLDAAEYLEVTFTFDAIVVKLCFCHWMF